MKFSNIIILMMATAILGACAKDPLPLVSIHNLAPTDTASTYTDALNAAQRGEQILEVRTYEQVKNPDNNSKSLEEFAGAACTIEGNGQKADFETPSGVRLPLYGINTPPLSLVCRKERYDDATLVVGTYNKTNAERSSAGAQAGLLGLLVMEMVNAASDDGDDYFEYGAPRVVMTAKTDTEVASD